MTRRCPSCEARSSGERKYYFTNHPPNTPRRKLVGAIKARWACEQAHQQLKDELGLDHDKGRSWLGLHHHALLTRMAFTYLQHRRLASHLHAGKILPPIGKQKEYPALTLTIIHVRERGAPPGRKPIDWKLITDLPVSSRSEEIEKLHWYAQRWKIETFHKILKSGCGAEDAKLRTADRLANLVSIFLYRKLAYLLDDDD